MMSWTVLKDKKASYAKNLKIIIRRNQLQQALVSGEVKEVLEVFGKQPRFETAVKFCEDNYDRVRECLKRCELKIPLVKEDFGEYKRNSLNRVKYTWEHKYEDIQYHFED